MYKGSCRGNSGLNLCMHRQLDDNKIECCSYTKILLSKKKIREAISPPQRSADLVDCAESSYVTQFFPSLFWNLENIHYYISFFSLSILSTALVMSLSVFLFVLSVLCVFLSFLIPFNLFVCYSYSFLFSFLLSFFKLLSFSTLLSDPYSVLSLSVHLLIFWSLLLFSNLLFIIFSFPIILFFLLPPFVLFLLNLFFFCYSSFFESSICNTVFFLVLLWHQFSLNTFFW